MERNKHWFYTAATIVLIMAACWIDQDTLVKTGHHSSDILFPLLAFCSFVMAVARWVEFLNRDEDFTK